MTTSTVYYRIVTSLPIFRNHILFAPGHDHLYGEFDSILNDIVTFRQNGHHLDYSLAYEILRTVSLLNKENDQGRRPWTGNWESYFAKCVENALRLLKEYCRFAEYEKLVTHSYCSRFLNTFSNMDHFYEHYAEYNRDSLSNHFLSLARMAAEMFSLVADNNAIIDEKMLEHPDDVVFTHLLTGFARTRKAKELVLSYTYDDESWVRHLASQLIARYYKY